MSIFKAPVGSEEERNSGTIWPGNWEDATGFAIGPTKNYPYGVHTGADLNLNFDKFGKQDWNADEGSPVYAMGYGRVTYAKLYSQKVWGKIIVIDHGTVDGKPLFSRYAHVAEIKVPEAGDGREGKIVRAGELIATIGDGEGIFKDGGHHLHFDISTTGILKEEPWHWERSSKQVVLDHYEDPKQWLMQQHVVQKVPGDFAPPSDTSTVWYVIAPDGAAVRKNPGSAEQVAVLPFKDEVSLEKAGVGGAGFSWKQISGGEYHGNWVAVRTQDQSESYLSTNRPQ